MKRLLFAGLAVLAAGACQNARSSAGFRLPPGGDVARGQAAFVQLECNRCHRVAGLDLPAPVAHPPVPVVLGGEIPHVKTDGHLVASIIHPSYRLPEGYPLDLIAQGEGSRMPVHREMTVGQLTDLVAFLQSRYEVIPPVEDGRY